MSGISATQLTTVVNAAGDPAPSTVLTGLATNTAAVLAIVGTVHDHLSWAIAAPRLSAAKLSNALTQMPTFTPDKPGPWTIVCQGFSSADALEATYILPLSIANVVQSAYVQPVQIASAAPNTVQPPITDAATLFPDSTDNDAPTWMRPDGSYAALVEAGATASLGGATFSSVADASVPTPASGFITVYYSTDSGSLVLKDSTDAVYELMVVT